MKRLIASTVVLAAFALTNQHVAAQTLKTDIFPASPQAYGLLAQYREIVGTVENNTGSTITLRVKYDHPVVVGGTNPPRTNTNNNRSRGRTNPLQQLQAIQRAQIQHMQQIKANTKMDHDFIDFELPLSDKVTVRRTSGGGLDFDQTGFPKETTAGEKGMVGVAAKADELKAGTQVKVYFGPMSTATPAKKDASGAIVSPAMPGGRPTVRMAVILEDNSPAMPPKKK